MGLDVTVPLGVTVGSLRDTSTGLESLASGFYNDGAGPELATAAGPVAGLDTGSACREVGDAFLRRAQALGDAASTFAGKLDSAAFLYEHGDSAAAERIEFDPPEEEEKRIGDDPGEPGYDPVNEYEDALREAGLLDGPSDGFYREWLANAAKKDARDATLMTYVLNAGTGYEDSRGSGKNSFAETPYAADEVQRIIDRQESNPWSYVGAELFSGRLAATPNGMLMGLGGNMVEDQLSQLGGSTVGDVFLVNIDNPADPAQQLRDIIDSGQAWYSEQRPLPGSTIDLDRILHHEERHSQQWADLGYENMVEQYGQKMVEEWITKQRNPFETNAGASDGGYS